MRIVRPIVKSIASVICYITFRMKVTGIENIPKEGAALVCPNHISNWDPVVAVIHIKRMIYAMAKEELFKGKLISSFFRAIGCFPVRRGGGDMSAVKAAEEYLGKGELVAIYPEGTRNGMKKGVKPKKGAALIATSVKVPIIPVGLTGTFKPFTKVHINVGKPIYFEEYYDKELTREELEVITDKIMTEIKNLIDI